MESSIFYEQGTIWAESDVFQIMQLTRNIPKDDKQYFLRAFIQESTSKLYEQFIIPVQTKSLKKEQYDSWI